MKAAVFHSKHNITVDQIDLREIKDNEVVINVKFCGVCGTDLHIFHGDDGAAKVTPPTVLGHEFSGIVTAVGKNVKTIKIGDRVSGDPNDMCGECYYCRSGKAHFCENGIGVGTTTNGGFAEYVIISEKQVYKIADNLSFEEASMTETVSCCVHGIDLCNINVGDTVLIIGGGPIGLIMLQLAKNAGASTVIVSEIVEEKRNLAVKLGADIVIDPSAENLKNALDKADYKINTVIECVGNTRTIAEAINCAGNGATIMLFGLTAPDAEVPVRPYDIFKRELHITSSFINPYTFKRALNLLESGRINVKSIITDIVDLDDITKVFTDDSYRRRGKILIKI